MDINSNKISVKAGSPILRILDTKGQHMTLLSIARDRS